MKRLIITISMIALCAFSLVGCNSEDGKIGNGKNGTITDNTPNATSATTFGEGVSEGLDNIGDKTASGLDDIGEGISEGVSDFVR